jgi:diaminopropionate ammonia-lyase
LAEYQPTPVISLPGLASQVGVGNVLVKDEAHRFGLKAFKALGASYAIYRLIKSKESSEVRAGTFYSGSPPVADWTYTFCTATDGNHGRGVAWIARKLKQNAVIYLPANTVRSRVECIRAEGAEAILVNGSYDDAVDLCKEDTSANGWQIVSDTSWQGYTEIPRWVMAGYITLFSEITEELGSEPDGVFVQGGVGALAAAAAWYYRTRVSQDVKLICVEPLDAACLLESTQSGDGNPVTASGKLRSVMAGLNCGIPSQVAWPFIREGFDAFVAIPDRFAIDAMRTYYNPADGDPQIISGESGAAGLAALRAIYCEESLSPLKRHLHLREDSRVLLLNTEGDTDPEHFAGVVSG